ncbi:hypothetical protein J2Z83_001448 [Virgibacillus natechei]|uniref:Ribbon-helix-helix protein, CopG family n=1 Tax=Virgibacillus natechei TaxID=1216297 RepID=A0ABS4IEI4_9BACI|nr:ribbon-helix-helix protein, CopG family [Virgibacillus natechei]MBP1969344.1 hypothetical protein [Virgibacillus natechei]UZD12493.1 ribbon-helix-helix protein, CopG family [Virgibacillus natechei]
MADPMKRKQFHMSKEDDKLLKDLAQSKGMSEAEVVREAVQEYAAKNSQQLNPLLEMAKEAEQHTVDSANDLSVNHDRYLREIHENEE